MEPVIIIPAYNEEKVIASVLKELQNHNYHNIIVVDDGSKDSTAKVAESMNVKVIKHPVNRGQGAALKTGIDYALEQGSNILVTFDADGQFKAEEIKSMIEPIQKKEVEITLGSRFLGKTINMPLLKKLTLKGGVMFTYIFSKIKLSDTHNGFKAFSKEAASQLELRQDRMAHASEIIDEINKKKIKFKEVPVTVIYTEYTKEKGQSITNSARIVFHLLMKKVAK